MGGISSGTGLFSGIDSANLINQLLAIESRPKLLAQRRVVQLQQQQAAYLDLNAKIGALKSAAAALRTGNIFQSNQATSSNADVLSATASTSAIPGSYSFIVDRLVSTQQMISRGFADAATSGVNAGVFTFEPAAARLDRDTSLADLNGGTGVSRGKIVISDSTGRTGTVDLTRAATVSEVIDAINGAGVNVTASVESGRFVVRSNDNSNLTIANGFGYTTAASLGIETTTPSATVTGAEVYTLGANTSIRSLNDGNGVFINAQGGSARYDFSILVNDGSSTTTVQVNLGPKYGAGEVQTAPAVTTVGGVMERITEALRGALDDEDISVSLGADGVSLRLDDAQGRTLEVAENPTAAGSTTARDLGLLTSSPQVGSVAGSRVLAGMNSTLARTLNGGGGLAGDGTFLVVARDGSQHNIQVDLSGSVSDILAAISAQSGGVLSAAINKTGTGISLSDHSGGTGNLLVQGETAESLGIATDPAGVAASAVNGANLQHQYVTIGTELSSLRNGQGVGTGTIRITDSTGAVQVVTVSSGTRTLDDLIRNINSASLRVKARINDNGDGLQLYEETGGGALKIKVEDVTGTVAASLNIKGEGAGTGAENVINGSLERTVKFEAGDTLQTVATKITAAGVGVSASVINDGAGSSPFRLTLTAKGSGSAGRFVIDTGEFDLGLTQLDKGQDARVFYGSTDPAKAVLLTSSRNTMDQVVTGVTIDLKTASEKAVTLTVSRDTAAVETAVGAFISAFNTLTERIAQQSRYDKDSNTKGPLLGDSTALQVRSQLFSMVQGPGIGVTGGMSRLVDVGITVGQGGELKLDREKFRVALEQDYQGVADLLSARVQKPTEPVQLAPGVTANDPGAPLEFTSLGVVSRIELLADGFINSVTGSLTRKSNAITSQIALQNKRITDFDSRLATRRTILERQFLAMEQAIGRLQTQQSSLGGMSSLL